MNIYTILKKYPKLNTIRRAPQVSSFCYLIAGMELLISCKYFVKLVQAYHEPELQKLEQQVEPEIPELYKITKQYLQGPPEQYYSDLERIIFKSMGINSIGETEDANVVFLCFQKSPLFNLIIDFKYTQPDMKNIKTRTFIYAFKTREKVQDIINTFKFPGIMAVAVNASNHYEIYQQVVYENKIYFYAKNTSYLLQQSPEIVYVIFDTRKLKK